MRDKEISETLSMQLSQMVVLQVQLLHAETSKDSSWKCGHAVAFQVKLPDIETSETLSMQLSQMLR